VARYWVVSGILKEVDLDENKIVLDVSGPDSWPDLKDFSLSDEIRRKLEEMGDDIMEYLDKEITLKLKDGIVVDIEFPE